MKNVGVFFKDILTETSKEYDVTRVCLFLFAVCYILMSVYMLVFEKKFDFLDWSIGASTILGAGGVSVGARARLEDKRGREDDNSVNKE